MKLEEFIKRAKKQWGDKFNYSETRMPQEKNETRVTIQCNRCGLVFRRNYIEHLRGVGCPICEKKEVVIHI